MNTEKNSIIAKRYAKSLIELTTKNNLSLEQMQSDLQNVEAILKSSAELYNAMTNPIISAKDKEEIIDAVFNQDANETVRNLLKLLISKNRFNVVFSVINIFNELLDNINNIAKIDVTCAIELDEAKKNQIKEKLNKKLQKTIDVNYKIDNSIIAGLVFKIGDDVIDTSVAHKLEEFKKEIIK